jgi:hypothetical protein
MCFPVGDPQGRGGLLPDFFLLNLQLSDGPAINPGTVQSGVAEAYGKTPLYTVTRFADGRLVHAPGEVRAAAGADGETTLTVAAWPEDGYRLLVTRVGRAPVRVRWNGADVAPQFVEATRVLMVPLTGSGTLSVVW